MSAVSPRLFLGQEWDTMWNRSSALTPEQLAVYIAAVNNTVVTLQEELRARGFTADQLAALDYDKIAWGISRTIEERLFPEKAAAEKAKGN
jgi:hypothetical protein